MKQRATIIFLLFCSFSADLFPQLSGRDQDLRRIIDQYGQAEVIIPYGGRKSADLITRKYSISGVKEHGIILVIAPQEFNSFIAEGYDYKVIDPPDPSDLKLSKGALAEYNWQGYPTYLQYDSVMRSFPALYPSLCRLDTIGTSINGRLVLVLKISDNAGVDEGEPAVFYTSSMHGDELGGYYLMLRLADYLLKNYSVSGYVKELADNLEIWINPLANPDGTYRSGNTIISPTRGNANGYDLNRNFPDPVDPPSVEQKETTDMIAFMREHRFALSANFHSGSEVVNYPWDRWLMKYHADDEWFSQISRAYADTVHLYSDPFYLIDEDNGVTRGAEWYVIYGGRQDFITWELQGREVTIEIDAIKQTPAAQLELLWQYNYRSLLRYIGNALYGIHGVVLDSETSEPLPARIFINGHDKDSSHIYSDVTDGRFVRLLHDGTWNLTFSSSGYRDTTVTAVVLPFQRTLLEIKMIPLTTSVDTTIPDTPVIYPNPSDGEFFCIVPDEICGDIDITIINTAGSVVYTRNSIALPGVPLQIRAGALSGGYYTITVTNRNNRLSSSGRIIIDARF